MVKFSSFFATALAVVTLASCSKESYTFRNSAPYGNTTTVAAVKAEPVTEAAAPVAEAPAAEAPAAELTASTVATPVAAAKHQAARTVKATSAAETKAAPTRAEVKAAKATLKAVHKAAKKANAAAPAAGGKSQLIALLLCIFVGGLGIHRFYLGYTGIGILMLLTLGLFGILTLIDLIRIITGDLKPKDGDYAEKL